MGRFSAVLGFYGVIVATAWAIWGVHITIKDSQESHEKEKLNAVLPFISFTSLNVHFSHPIIATLAYHIDKSKSEESAEYDYKGYQETAMNTLWIQIDNDDIKYLMNLSKEQEEQLKYDGYYKNKDSKIGYKIPLVIPFVLKNVGIGAAIDVRIGLNRKKNHTNNATQSMQLSMSPNDEFELHIFAESPTKENDIWGEYELKIRYKNIFGDLYEQICSITLKFDEQKNRAGITLVLVGEQELIKRNK